MYIGLNDDHLMIQDTARKFATDQLAPIAAELDQGGRKQEFLENLKSMAELGFMGLNVDSEYGGAECGVIAFSLAISEAARACAASAVTMSVTNMVAELIATIGTEDQKREHVTKICSGEYPAASFCLSESGAGSDPSGMKTKARKDGGDWVLSGSKMWISSAEYAGVFVVWAVTDPDAVKGKGITCFLVPGDSPGIVIGKAERKMGQRASSTATVSFNDCRVPVSAVLGEVNQGYRIATTELAGGRIGIGSLALGIGLAAMDVAREYSLEREQFGQPISRNQGIQWMLADHYTELEAARLLVLNAAFQKESGRPFSKQASMGKLYASEAANRACYSALQIMGGLGYTEELPLERFARDVRVTSIYEGTSEIQRMIIARELLREVS
ncbi:MAG: acyl-CoA dehydrogenase family protein [Henriciella sp.]|nr:acyl-CoA dehydrogenase family protein [Henriciella sp.]